VVQVRRRTEGGVTPKPSTVVDLVWIDELTFSTVSRPQLIIDSAGAAGPLSREKYCSLWHSMRQDIDFRVTIDLVP